jgi:dipeptidyl-peptidase-4
MKHLVTAFAISLFSNALCGEMPLAAEPLPIERIFEGPSLDGPVARGVALSPDGRLVTFLRPKDNDPTVLDLWFAPVEGDLPAAMMIDSHVLSSGDELSEAEIARRERQRVFSTGIVEYQWDNQGRYLLVPVSGELFLADSENGRVFKRIPRDAGGADATDAQFSPLGGYISFIRNSTLMVAPTLGGEARAISPPGEGALSYGMAEFIAQEEMARDTGAWWSPDDKAIAYTKVDESDVATVKRFDIGAGSNASVNQRFPFAGSANADVELFVQSLSGGPPIRIDLGDDPDIYLARVHWSVDGRTLYIQRQSRDQKRLDLLAADPGTGTSTIILTESRAPWVNLTKDFTPLKDGTFLWVSERSGYRHLYLHDRDGQLIRQVTSGDFPLGGFDRQASLIGVNEDTGTAFVLASASTPIERHLYAVDYRGGGTMRQVTEESGWWTPSMNAGATAFIGNFSSPDTPPQTGLYDADGSFRRWIVENRFEDSHPYYPFRAGIPQPEFGQIEAEDGQRLDYVLLKPANFDPSQRYPAIVQVYGGPGRQYVTKAWRPVTERILLDAGFVLFQLDNRGAANRGLRFEGAIAGNLGSPEIIDQIRGLRFLQSLPFIASDRVGVTGWSYGGYLTLRLLTEPGSGFVSGAAGAAPGDWRQYDTHYTERFLGKPQDNPAAYDAASVVPRLKDIEGRLLLMHGMSDDNVLFDNATAIMSRLQQQGTAFDLMLYPGQRHSIQGPMLRLHQWRTYLDFFQRTLSPRTDDANFSKN